MTDSSIAQVGRHPYDFPMEDRVARLEDDMREVKSGLSRLEPMIVRINATLAATLPNLATKAELANLRTDVTKEISDLRTEMIARFADVPTKTCLWGILGVLITAYGSGLAALATLK